MSRATPTDVSRRERTEMGKHHTISRRRFLGVAAGAAATARQRSAYAFSPADQRQDDRRRAARARQTAALDPPRQDGHDHVHPARRPSPGRHRRQRGAGRRRRRWASSAGPTSPRIRTTWGRSSRCRAAGGSCSSSSPTSGFEQIEFAGYGQNASNPGGAAPNPAPGGVTTPGVARRLPRLRPHAARLPRRTSGSRRSATTASSRPPGPVRAARAAPCRPTTTSGSRPSSSSPRSSACRSWAPATTRPAPTTATSSPGTVAGEKWEALNDLSRQWCIQLYPHNHSPAYNFLQDGPMVRSPRTGSPGRPSPRPWCAASPGKRLMQHYLDITDPRLCFVEMDIYWAHVAQHQWRWRYDWDGNRVEDIFDPTRQVARQTKRYALFHAKDGDRTDRGARCRQRLQHHPVRRPAQRHRLRALLQAHRRQGLPQLQLRAGQRPRRRRRPRPVAPPHHDQRPQHAGSARLTLSCRLSQPARRSPPGGLLTRRRTPRR